METRIEFDSIGSMEIPKDVYYGVQTYRAFNNFRITNKTMHPAMIISLAEIKKAAAITNKNAKVLSDEIADSIAKACDEIIAGKLHDQFIVDPIQGGAGTSANMNANEVIANRAIEILGGTKGDYTIVHPNDHVNMGQSTNDVYPTSGKLTTLRLLSNVIEQLERLKSALNQKASEFDKIVKIGRTQLQDAVPIRLGQSFEAYAEAIGRDIRRFNIAQEELSVVNMGATAIGTSVNASPEYIKNIVSNLKNITDLNIVQAGNLVDGTQNLDSFVSVSGVIKACGVNLSKMANDFRLLSMGPKAGLGEIILPPMQNGSSIMPGKINPVIPEVVSQVAYNLMGNDISITMAAEAGQLELNAFEPVLFYNLFESLETLKGGIRTFVDNCITGIKANEERCHELLENSLGTVTALCPYIGYKKSAEIAKKSLSTGIPIRKLVIDEGILNEEEAKSIMDPYKMTKIVEL